MNKLYEFLDLKGSFDGYTFYKKTGSKKLIMRRNKSRMKEEVIKEPKSEVTRNNPKEIGACTKFGSLACGAFGDFNDMSDYSFNSELIRIGFKLLKLDTVSEKGKRNLQLSAKKNELYDFDFSNKMTFDRIVGGNLKSELDWDSLIFEVEFSHINPIFIIPIIRQFSVFRFVLVLGRLSDIIYNPELNIYEPVVVDLEFSTMRYDGLWFSKDTFKTEHIMRGQLPENWKAEMTENVNLILSIAIEFGNNTNEQDIKVLDLGFGKVLNVF